MVRISDCSSKPVRILSYTLIVTGAIVLTMFIIPLFSGTLNTGSYFGFVIGGVTVLLGIFTPKLFSNAKKAVRYIFRAVLIIYGVLAVYAITLSAFMIANMNDAPEKDGSRTARALCSGAALTQPAAICRRILKPTASFRAVRAITSISARPRLCMKHSLMTAYRKAVSQKRTSLQAPTKTCCFQNRFLKTVRSR